MSALSYVYCLVASRRAPRPPRARLGLPGLGKLRVLDAGGGLWLACADAPAARFGEAAIARGLEQLDWVAKCAIAHEAVVEYFASADAVVPLKLFTLFTSDTRALGFVAGMRPKLDRVVRRVTGCDEWGVRVSLDKRRAYAGARKAAPRPAAGTPSGTSFLLRKKQEHDITRSLTARAAEQAREIYDELAAIARECQRRPPAGGPEVGPAVLLDAVFLVSSGQEKRFQAALRRATKQAAEHGLGVTLTGPWPPYHFAHVQTARAAS